MEPIVAVVDSFDDECKADEKSSKLDIECNGDVFWNVDVVEVVAIVFESLLCLLETPMEVITNADEGGKEWVKDNVGGIWFFVCLELNSLSVAVRTVVRESALTEDNSGDNDDDNEPVTENTEYDVGVFWSSVCLEIDVTAEKLRSTVFDTGMDAIMDVDEEANRDNTEVPSWGANVILASRLIFSTFVDDNSRSAELEIDDTPCNNVVWALISFVLLIVFTFVVEFNSVFSDTRPSVTSGELL